MKENWQQTLTDLRLQMTVATFEATLAGSYPLSLDDDRLTVHVASRQAEEFLNNRPPRGLAAVIEANFERPLIVLFTANGHAPSTGSGHSPALPPQPAPAPVPADTPAALALAQFDPFGNNWHKHPRYLSLFYQPYFSTFTRFAGSRALPVWQFIRDRIYDRKGDRSWTPVWEVLLKDLAQLIGCTSQQLTGCWRPCPIFERGEVEGTCCYRYGMKGERSETACRYWASGVFQLLVEHGLAVVHQLGTAARNTRFAVQVYRRPMLLTPWQVDRLSDDGRRAHREFMVELGIDLEMWEQIGTKSLGRVWRDEAGLSLATEGDGVLNAIAFKTFFLPPD